jgi:hypothetical protein
MRPVFILVCLAVALAVAVPAAAQQDAASAGKPKHAARISKPPAPAVEASRPGVYMGYCGQWFGCYTGIPLRCGDNTRPYQDIANHACFCVHDGCPQQ